MWTIKTTVIFIALIGGLYSTFLNLIRYRSANNPTPENLKDVYDAETYEKWKQYSKEHNRLKILSSIVSCLVTILLLITNAYAAFAMLFPYTLEWQVFAVILLESLVSTAVGVVESYIANMKIEQKYGFNRSSVKTFIADRLRSFIAMFVLSYAFAFAIGVCYYNLGIMMIPAFAILAFLFSMIVSFLYPLLSRIGNKFTPLPDGELRDSLKKLLDKYGYKVKEIQVMDASRRTTKLNAYFTGTGKLKTIVLYDNLLNALSAEEICAVFAHELGHGLHKDVQKRQILNIFQLLLIGTLAYLIASAGELYMFFGFNYLNSGFAYIVIGICLSVLQPIIGFITNAHSRRAEFRADCQAVIEGYGEAMISAFKKMARDNFSHLSPSWINVVLEYSHPPLKARIKSVEREMKRFKKTKSKK